MKPEDTQDLERIFARSAVSSRLFPSQTEPERVGRYVIEEKLGAGGMGVVFRALDPDLRRHVAIKLLRPDKAPSSSGQTSPLLREARSIARLAHPNVVTVYDVGFDRGHVFVALELVTGLSLQQWSEKPRTWRDAAAVLAGAARGLQAAHDIGILHRDVKPANVLLGDDGRVCVVDFGLATAEASPDASGRGSTFGRRIAGTPAYMAPEQHLGASQDARTDQFAFCVMAFEVFFGQRPFRGDDLRHVRDAILGQSVQFPSRANALPFELCHAIEQGLSKNRSERHANLTPLIALLDSASSGVHLPTAIASDPLSAPPEAQASQSRLDRYLSALPSGIDSYPEHRASPRISSIALSLRPLQPVPGALAPALESMRQDPVLVSMVHTRAIQAAIFDQHFDSLEQWRAFMSSILRPFMSMQFIGFLLQPPESPHFVETLCTTFNRFTQGYELQIAHANAHAAEFVIDHPPHSMLDLVRISLCEAMRLGMQLAGCNVAEARIASATSTEFRIDARWS